jgi:hypothetical protein
MRQASVGLQDKPGDSFIPTVVSVKLDKCLGPPCVGTVMLAKNTGLSVGIAVALFPIFSPSVLIPVGFRNVILSLCLIGLIIIIGLVYSVSNKNEYQKIFLG